MQFLANENFPVPSIRLLREAGYVVRSILEECGGISDENVLELATQNSLIILTFDRDYGELLFKYKKQPPPAVLYFRMKGEKPTEAGTLLLAILQAGKLVLEGYFTVLEETAIRQRKLIA